MGKLLNCINLLLSVKSCNSQRQGRIFDHQSIPIQSGTSIVCCIETGRQTRQTIPLSLAYPIHIVQWHQYVPDRYFQLGLWSIKTILWDVMHYTRQYHLLQTDLFFPKHQVAVHQLIFFGPQWKIPSFPAFHLAI